MDIVERSQSTAFYRMIFWRIVKIGMIAFVSIITWDIFKWARAYPWAERSIARNACQTTILQQEAAWNDGDLDGFMLGYWNDPELTFYADNTIEKGYEPLKQRYFKRYKAEGKEMGRLMFSDVGVHAKSGAFAVVRGQWKVVKSAETAEGLFTLWVEKKPEGWRIIHDHTSAAPK